MHFALVLSLLLGVFTFNSCAAPRGTSIYMYDSFLPYDPRIEEIVQGYMSGRLNVTSVLNFYLARIQKYDKTGLKLNSVIETDPDAIMVANAMDSRLSACRTLGSKNKIRECVRKLGKLFGIPILVKDNIATAGKMQTAAGSLALVGSIVPDDATVVKQLKEAGALVFGKAAMTEWASFRAGTVPAGWGGRSGQVLNPHFNPPTPDVGGSSSGCGVSVAAGLAPICIGTETSGSIIHPSIQNKVIGLKPTVKSISQEGIIPVSNDLDVAGPIATNVDDVGLVWSILANKTWDNMKPLPNRTITIGIAGADQTTISVFGQVPEVKLVMMEKIVLEDMVALTKLANSHCHCRFREDMKDYLSTLKNTSIRSMKDIVDFNKANAKEEKVAEYGQNLMEEAVNAPTYRTNSTFCNQIKDQIHFQGKDHPQYGFRTLKQKYGFDLLIGESPIVNIIGSFATYPMMHYAVGNASIVALASAGDEKVLLDLGRLLETIGSRPIPSMN